ncbi:1,4-dihydroxy-2-naphtoate prenyltransferase [Desulforamulus reducens MI-1]|uniref:1,4-dihydroxy-2-naphthoate octaprenyltransferase n=1 Tax=Desulforamulus reducens (strain ATCC BAA-1160 / DSM 100696 / MI-1) TaxID=349161 RepID=A4J882_DESRM|nr:1,4-dihydroxy-2-naphthoate polyprenyltransferase [Desulforamulus reducens]ABO51285.1 1,4-dihydroxy-2-naphtoate prenyltransferase [Desulforamulus reducens MI-1]
MSQETENLSRFKIWMLAIRPKTLPAAMGPVLVGAAIAIGDHAFSLLPTLVALLVSLLLQIGSNLANDVFDFKKGKDTKERTGPLRVTQAGLLTPRQVMVGMGLVFALAFALGLYLTWVGGWVILALGIAAIISAIAYTGGPFPLGYHGLGEVFVFIFFGPVAVCGTYYVQAGNVSAAAWWASLPVGLLITAILVVNNYRDLPQDKKTGKRTIAVRLGPTATQVEYFLLLAVSFAVPLIMWLQGIVSAWILFTWLSLPFVLPLIGEIRTKKGRPLNATLAGTARFSLIFSIFFSVGYLFGKLA